MFEWEKAIRRSMHMKKGYGKGERQQIFDETRIVTYYFTKFPSNYGVEALWRMFLKWGKGG